MPYPSAHGFTGTPEALDGKAPGVHHTLHCVPLLHEFLSPATRQSQALLLRMPASQSLPQPSLAMQLLHGANGLQQDLLWATGVKDVFVSAKGIPNPLWLLHSLLGCAPQGNVGV